MNSKKIILLSHLLLVFMFTLEAVKIGISKPLPLSTTLAPNTTTTDLIIEETTMETIETSTVSITASTEKTTLKTTTTTASSSEAEWPEFPPQKTLKSTTKKPTITTIKPSATSTFNTTTDLENEENSTINQDLPETFHPKHSTNQKYCFCDINPDMCDINCCCDTDCSPDILKVFHCLVDKPNDLAVHEGRFEDFKFQHGLPSCEVNDGWLCVFRTNKPIIKEEFTISYGDTSDYYKWPNLLLETQDVKSRDFYMYGDILRIINMETKEIQNFDLPSSFNTALCQIREPVYHLKDLKRFCLIYSNKTLQEIFNELHHLQENYKIFIKPTIPEDLLNNKDLQNYVGHITIYKCIENDKICSKYSSKEYENDYEEFFKIKVNILHNFTHIHEIVLELWFRSNNELTFEDTFTEYWLEYEINFLNKTLKELYTSEMYNNDKNKLKIVSGALGYLAGKPLILGRYEPFNKTLPISSKNQVINYFLENNTASHTLALFGKKNGECIRHYDQREYIDFGINTAKYCKIKLNNATLLWEEPLKTNFTKICLNLQDKVHDQLFGKDLLISDLTSYMISQLGKPENNSKKWLPLQVYNTDFNSVFGQYIQETNTFICRNILLSLSYEFYMATITVNNVRWQNIITHAALHLAERHDLEFALDENFEVPITVTVRFLDAHEKAVSAAGNFRKFILVNCFIVVELVMVLSIRK